MVWRTMKPFLNERMKQKVCFIDQLSLEALRESRVHLDELPRELGGSPEAFSVEKGR